MRRRAAGTLDVMDNLIALVTGANKGIGREIARQLAAVGHTVYVGSRDAARGEKAVAEIGGDARLLVLDVTEFPPSPAVRRTWVVWPVTSRRRDLAALITVLDNSPG